MRLAKLCQTLYSSMTEQEKRRYSVAIAFMVALAIAASMAIAKMDDAEAITATWYGPGFYGNHTASGEVYTGQDLTAAHPSLPFGTVLNVTGPNGKTVPVKINDRCSCSLDLSEGAAQATGVKDAGSAQVTINDGGTASVNDSSSKTSSSSSTTSSGSSESSVSEASEESSEELESLPQTAGDPELIKLVLR